jgi:hypothetical protein
MDSETLVLIAGLPVYGLVMIVLSKTAVNMFFSQQDLQTVETATPPSK